MWGGEPGCPRSAGSRILPRMGRLILQIAAGVAVVIGVFWILSVLVGLLVWLLMIALVIGVVFLGIKMLQTDARH